MGWGLMSYRLKQRYREINFFTLIVLRCCRSGRDREGWDEGKGRRKIEGKGDKGLVRGTIACPPAGSILFPVTPEHVVFISSDCSRLMLFHCAMLLYSASMFNYEIKG
jgi:hypothetical protein